MFDYVRRLRSLMKAVDMVAHRKPEDWFEDDLREAGFLLSARPMHLEEE